MGQRLGRVFCRSTSELIGLESGGIIALENIRMQRATDMSANLKMASLSVKQKEIVAALQKAEAKSVMMFIDAC